MKNLVNIHCHLLAGVDDGAKSPEESLRMLDAMYNGGVRTVCVTPHGYPKYPRGTAELHIGRYNELRSMAKEKFPDLHLLLGQEIYYHSDCVKKLLSGECLTLNKTRNVLVEFDPGESLPFIRSGLSAFLTAGFHPVLAHAERYSSLSRNKKSVEELRDMGALIQVNADTLLGKYGFFQKRYAFDLIKRGHVDIVADDCHSTGGAGRLSEAYDAVLRKFGERVAERMFCDCPDSLLHRER